MRTPRRLRRSEAPAGAVLLGLAGGMRTFAPPLALVTTGELAPAGGIRRLLFAATLGELIADKLPATPSRWAPAGVIPRLGFSAWGGHRLAGGSGALSAGAVSLLAAYTGSRLRSSVRGGGAQLAAALAEDSLSYTLAFAAIRMSSSSGPEASSSGPEATATPTERQPG